MLDVGTSPYIQDTRLRVSLEHVYFHQSSADLLIGSINAFNIYILQDVDGIGYTEDEKWNVEHIFIKGGTAPDQQVGGLTYEIHPNGAQNPFINGVGHHGYIRAGGWYSQYYNNGVGSNGWVAANFVHELCHAWGLPHNFYPGGCDACSDNDGVGQPCPSVNTTNNYMDGSPTGWTNPSPGLSQCQMGIMHYYLDGNDPSHTIYRVLVPDHCVSQTDQTVTITGDRTWLDSRRLKGDLIIEPGASLTIKCRVHMPEDGNVIVKPGGRLIIDEGLFTNLCDESWSGIQVWGANSQNQWGAVVGGAYRDFAHQGLVDLVNGGTIEHALVGISMQQPGVSGTSGGVVRSNGGVFRNCGRAVEFFSYQNTASTGQGIPTSNRSYFYNTAFAIDVDYRGTDDFSEHVSLWDVSGVTFSGCSFANELTTIEESALLGYGIKSLDASYVVRSSCSQNMQPGTACPEMLRTPCTFTGLDHGIHALQGNTTRNFQVDGALFTDNICAVYSEGIVGFKVVNSKFELGGNDVEALTGDIDATFLGFHRGVFTNTGYGFIIDDNRFLRSGPAPTEGIVVGYSEGHNDMIFRNEAGQMDAAYVGEGVCADPNARSYIGLHYQCNINSNNTINLWSRKVDDPPTFTDQTIRTHQGKLVRAPDHSFDRVAANWDIKNTNSEDNTITYWWAAPNTPFEPVYIDPPEGVITTNNFNGTHVDRPTGNCASRRVILTYPFPPRRASLMSGLMLHRDVYVANRYLYKTLLDGGNTDALVEEVESSWPQEVWDLRNSLLQKSPYLTVTVLKEMMLKPTLPMAIKAEVCIANPDATKTEGFVKYLEYDAQPSMPPNLLISVVASWETKTFRTTMEATLAHDHGEMTQNANLLLEYHWADSLEQVDSLRSVWQLIRTPAARYAEALTFLQQGRFAEAQAVVEALPEEHDLRVKQESERWRMLAVIEFLQTLGSNGRSTAQLTTNEQDELEAIIADQRDRPATWAQNILCFHYGRCRAPLTGGELGTPKSRKVDPDGIEQTTGPTLQVFPNPTSRYATIEVDLVAPPQNAAVVVKDVAGRVLFRLNVSSTIEQLVFDSRELASGSYTFQLESSGNVLVTEQLIIKQ